MSGEDRLDLLRRRFLAIAASRVPRDVVEDMVQDALLVVVRRAESAPPGESSEGLPRLDWCFQVLRNTIGNYYLRTARRSRRQSSGVSGDHCDPGTTPMEALEAKELREALQEALEVMRVRDPECGRAIDRLVGGASPAELAAEIGVEPAVFYRRLYRCRMKLKSLLEERGVKV